MKLTDFLLDKNICVPLKAGTKPEAIRELVERLNANGELLDSAKVLASVLDREAVRTTGIGQGLAVPHGKTDGVGDLKIAVGICAKPIEFQSLDGKPACILWLLVSRPDQTQLHISTLAQITKLMRNESVQTPLLAAPDAATAMKVIQSVA